MDSCFLKFGVNLCCSIIIEGLFSKASINALMFIVI